MDLFHDSSLKMFGVLEASKLEDEEYLKIFQSTLDNIFKDVTNLAQTPQKNKKKHKRNNTDRTEVVEAAEPIPTVVTESSSRPVRSAAAKASSSMKEPSLVVKLRRPKLERISDESTKNVASSSGSGSSSKENSQNSVNIKREKISTALMREKRSDSPKLSDGEEAKKAKLDASVEIIQHDESIISVPEDDAADKMMPPPAMVPPINGLRKQRNLNKGNSTESDLDQISISEIKIEKNNVKQLPVRSTRSKVRPKASTESQASSKNKNIDESQPITIIAEISQESIYEDALASRPTINEPSIPDNLYKSFVVLQKLQPSNEADPMNATYNAKPNQITNETFNVANETYQLASNNQTITLAKATVAAEPTLSSDIMTDDESEEEDRPVNKVTKKELFNPCVRSPLRNKIEAFENIQALSPATLPPQRQTRTKTRAKHAKENVESVELVRSPSAPSFNLKYLTPHSKPYTPNVNELRQQSGMQSPRPPLLTKAASASRLQIPLSREHSVERAKRVIQASVDEKKRKREEKLKQVQQQRELKEKEKIEKYKKHMEEKEEKARQEAIKKQAQKEKRDAEVKRKMEEMAKIQEQIRLQRQKDAETEEARLIAIKEQERINNLKIEAEKQRLKMQLKQNELASRNARAATNKKMFQFESLDTDDSTDDERKTSKKRDAPPVWSLKQNRQEIIKKQAEIPSDVIDTFFSVEPMTIDLRSIFPSIDERHLKRNSSAIWNTPPH